MPTDLVSRRVRKSFAPPEEVACSWCGLAVPLPAGDFSGVCIDCGTVMFREIELPLALKKACFEQRIRNMDGNAGNHIGRTIPAPAV